MRQRPDSSGRRSAASEEMGNALRVANRLWRDLDAVQAEAWHAYARSLIARDPETGLLATPKAVNLFVGLTVKVLQVHGGFDAPIDPPTGVFLGDVVGLTAFADGADIVFTADRANRDGVLTELLTQRLNGPNNAPRPRSYKSQGFVAFPGLGSESRVTLRPGTFYCAYRFVEAASGRTGAMVPIGRVTVTAWPEIEAA